MIERIADALNLTAAQSQLLLTGVWLVSLAVARWIVLIVVLTTGDDRTTSSGVSESVLEQVEEIAEQLEEEEEDSEIVIARIKDMINSRYTGMNAQGEEYIQWFRVDRRFTEAEEYLVTFRYNADDLEGGTEQKREFEHAATDLFRLLYASDEKIEIVTFEAFLPESFVEVYSVWLEGDVARTVDWSQDVDTLSTDILPSIWDVHIDKYQYVY